MYVLRMAPAGFWGDSQKMFPACFYMSFKYSNSHGFMHSGIAKAMSTREVAPVFKLHELKAENIFKLEKPVISEYKKVA